MRLQLTMYFESWSVALYFTIVSEPKVIRSSLAFSVENLKNICVC